MARHVNYRRSLLAAVDAFLEQTPQSLARAHRLVRACNKSLKPFTLNNITWGPTVSTLRDSLYFENPAYLSNLRTVLREGSQTIHRVYMRRDFRADLTTEEQEWLVELWELLAFLRRFPALEVQSATVEYEERSARVVAAQGRASTPTALGDEKLYHLLLREVTVILTGINLQQSLRRYRYLVPAAPYSWLDDTEARQMEPDVSLNVTWASNALRAISGEYQLLMTWQVKGMQAVIVLA
jgi:hypothetical protein